MVWHAKVNQDRVGEWSQFAVSFHRSASGPEVNLGDISLYAAFQAALAMNSQGDFVVQAGRLADPSVLSKVVFGPGMLHSSLSA